MPLDALPAAARRRAGARGPKRHDAAGAQRAGRADRRRVDAGGGESRLATVAGSDAHTLRRVGTTWTEAPGRDSRRVPGEPARRASAVRAGAHGGARAVAGDAYGVIGRYIAQPGRIRAARSSRLAPRRLSRRSPSVSLPFQFLPLAIAAAGKSRERREVARAVERCARRPSPDRGRRRDASSAVRRTMSAAVAITGIGLVTALGATREESWRRHARGRVRHPAGDGVRRGRAIAAASPPKSPMDGDRRAAHAARAPPAVARRSHRRARRRRGDRRRGPARRRASIASRIGVFLGAGTGGSAAQRGVLPDLDHRRARARAAVGRLESLSRARRSTSIAERFGFEGPRALRRRRLLVEHDRDRPRRRRDPAGPRRRRARRRHRRAVAADVQRLQPAAADGPGAVPAVRSQPRRHEHRRRRRHPRARGPRSRARAAAPRSTPSSPATRSACEAFHPTAPEPEGRPVAAVVAAALRGRRHRSPTTSITSTRTAPRRRRTTPPRRAGSGACSATASARMPVTSIKSMIGHCLGAAGAVEAAALALTRRARRDSADDPPRRDRRRVRGRRRRQPARASSASAARVSTSLGFGGNDSALVIRRVRGAGTQAPEL